MRGSDTAAKRAAITSFIAALILYNYDQGY
jgi:hypothetical protein